MGSLHPVFDQHYMNANFVIVFHNIVSEHILQALKSLETPEEKLAALCKRYTDLLDDHRMLQNRFKVSEKKLMTVLLC